MKILIDMNLSPAWVQEFKLLQIEAIHERRPTFSIWLLAGGCNGALR